MQAQGRKPAMAGTGHVSRHGRGSLHHQAHLNPHTIFCLGGEKTEKNKNSAPHQQTRLALALLPLPQAARMAGHLAAGAACAVLLCVRTSHAAEGDSDSYDAMVRSAGADDDDAEPALPAEEGETLQSRAPQPTPPPLSRPTSKHRH